MKRLNVRLNQLQYIYKQYFNDSNPNLDFVIVSLYVDGFLLLSYSGSSCWFLKSLGHAALRTHQCQ